MPVSCPLAGEGDETVVATLGYVFGLLLGFALVLIGAVGLKASIKARKFPQPETYSREFEKTFPAETKRL